MDMNIGKIIYDLRKARGMTQEQLAEAVGVSVPAVSKWETGISLPDITMLAPVARLLGTSIDNLLSYNMDLTKEEVENLYKDIKAECDKNGFRMGMLLAFSLLKEYPNSDYLKLKIAMSSLNLSYSIEDDYSEEEYSELSAKTTKLLEKLIHSDNYDISFAAKIGLATRYMSVQKLNEAEQLLNQLPRTEYSAKRMLPALYTMKEEYAKSLESAEQNLLQDIINMRVDIMDMYSAKEKQGDYETALLYAENYNQITKIYGNHLPSGADMFVNVYLKSEDMENAIKWFQVYVEDIINIEMDYSKSPFFTDVAKDIIVTNDVEDNIKTAMYKSILLNPHYDVIRDKKEYIKCMEELKACVKA
jgi:transcriptional regulator with XRE-family HTH domain